MEFSEVVFQTDKQVALKDFYIRILGFEPAEISHESFSLKTGKTRLTFGAVYNGTSPFYHFAFNIPPGLFSAAKSYMMERVELISKEGEDTYEFVDWNAKAFYFFDPAGNIVEFIARFSHYQAVRVDRFGPEQVLNVSEVGLPVKDVKAFTYKIYSEWEEPVWKAPFPDFKAVGDEEGLFIVVAQSRVWFPIAFVEATPFPLVVRCRHKNTSFTFDQFQFQGSEVHR